MMIRNLLFLLLFVVNPLRGDDSIVVQLATESRLLPIYATPIRDGQTTLSHAYLEQLEEVLAYDLSHNGMTRLLPLKRETTERAWSGELSIDRDNAFYSLTLEAKGQDLEVRLETVSQKSVQAIQPLALTGNLRVDRRVMHQLADVVHELLFGKPGVSSSRLLYTVRHKNPDPNGPQYLSEVWEADWDGENARQITFDGSYCVTPTYVPPRPGYGSGNFCYVSYKTGQPKIFIASLQAADRPQRLMSLRGNQLMPAVAANRRQVAFVNDVTGNPDLFLQRFDPDAGPIGKPYQIFATRQGTQGSPTFSPDSRQIAFVSNKEGTPRIYLMDVPGPGTRLNELRARAITLTNRENTAPAWSPDGTKIAYCAKTNGTRQIWIYDLATGKESQLTAGPGHKENPSWAPNSLHLTFNSADYQSSELYVINLNQPTALRISKGEGEKRFPDWEPR